MENVTLNIYAYIALPFLFISVIVTTKVLCNT